MIPLILDVPNLTSLSLIGLIPEEKALDYWNDFVAEVNNSIDNKTDFVYPDIALVEPINKNIHSSYITGLIDGKIWLKDYIKSFKDERKRAFAGIIYFLLHDASFHPVSYKKLGVFYFKARLPKRIKNPQTGEIVETSLKITLGFFPEKTVVHSL